jgi:polynucleotide 5'-hydroxyl-kinase GRC3/NOL9
MSLDWAENTAQQLLSKDLFKKGICLFLGASDTGKTTLAEALTKQLVKKQMVGIVDADIGQSHIGPPTTVGWALVDNPDVDFSKITAGGISFVGDITPVGHLLQLTSAIAQCVQQVSELTELIVIDTPGLVYGPAACALWWTMQKILKPQLILAVQKSDEPNDILAGLRFLDSNIELIQSPPEIQIKSPQQRKRHRQNQFEKYFRDSCLYNISLNNISVQSGWRLSHDALSNRLVGLRAAQGVDLAIGIINDWQADKDNVIIRAPELDIRQIRCLVIGDVTIDLTDL